MANVAALRKKAADFEQKKQLDRAIAAYREILDVFDAGDDDNIDVGLYNRVGDLLVRQGNTPDAVTLYERAVDLYAEGGFFNNAIALCNKILRTSPGRATVYYKLGKISAAKGFNGDAKSNFLEYADRMQKSGRLEEAFRALKEFADLCPDQDDIRLMLAEQLTKADRKTEALDQLQLLYARYDGEGRTAEAQATFERMRALDPHVEAKSADAGKREKSDELIFIDLDAPAGRASRHTRGISTKIESVAPPLVKAPPAAPPAEQGPPAASPDLATPLSVEAIREREPTPQTGTIEGLETTSWHDLPIERPAPETVADPVTASGTEGLPESVTASLPAAGTEPTLERATDADAIAEPAPLEASAFAAIDLRAIPEAASGPHYSLRDLALPGELPRFDDDGTPITGSARVSAELSLPSLDLDGPPRERDRAPAGIEPAGAVERPSGELIELGEFADEPEPPAGRTEAAAPALLLPRRSAAHLADSVGVLRLRLVDEPENWALRRQFAEALLDDGARDEGLKELEAALVGFEKSDDLEAARSLADEIIRLNPGSVRHHQKRVEYAFRSNDKPRLTEAYVELADALFRDGQAEKARQVYQRVLELSPDDPRAHTALEAFGTPPSATESPAAPRPAAVQARPATPPKGGRRYTAARDEAPGSASAEPVVAPSPADDDFISLGDWLRNEERPKSTRMVVDEEAPTGDEEADFADMLRKFKQGIAENVDAEDHEAHYDLGVAYKEMGLLDEAIAEFQRALGGHLNRVRTYEALGHCFLEKKQLRVAATILQRALSEPGAREEQLVGVLYLLGYVNESLGKPADAKGYYERVFGLDIQFRDVGDRLNAVDKALAS